MTHLLISRLLNEACLKPGEEGGGRGINTHLGFNFTEPWNRRIISAKPEIIRSPLKPSDGAQDMFNCMRPDYIPFKQRAISRHPGARIQKPRTQGVGYDIFPPC